MKRELAGVHACTVRVLSTHVLLQDKPAGGQGSLSILDAAPAFPDDAQGVLGPSQRSSMAASSSADAEEGGSFGPGKVCGGRPAACGGNDETVELNQSTWLSRCCWAAAQSSWRPSLW